MRNCNDFILVKNESNNTLNEYMIIFDKNQLKNYTKNLKDKDGNDLIIKEMFEKHYLKKYTDPKGILSINKLDYLTSYIYNESGPGLYEGWAPEDYDSFLSMEEKKQIIFDYLNLLEFVLINTNDLTFFHTAYEIFNNLSTPGISGAFKGTERILEYGTKAELLFREVGFKIEEKAKVLTKI